MAEETENEEVEETPSPGELLAAERERQGLTVPQLARDLHLDPTLLEHMEADEFDEIGAPVFVKGHLKSYAKRLGLDADSIVDAYRVTQPGSDELTATARDTLPPVRDRGPIITTIVLIVLVAAAGFGLWYWLSARDGAPVVRQPTESAVPEPANAASPERVRPESNSDLRGAETSRSSVAVTAEEESPDSGSGLSSAGDEMNQSAASSGVDGEMPVDMPVDVADAGEPESMGDAAQENVPMPDSEPEARLTEDPQGSGIAESDAGTDAASLLAFRLDFSGDCWVEISDADGRLEFDLQRAGSTLDLAGNPPVTLLIGNASATTLTVAGQLVPIPRRRIVNNVARLQFPRDLGDGL